MTIDDDFIPAQGDMGVHVLYDLIAPSGKWPLPASFRDAQTHDRVGRLLYGAGDHRRAGDRFVAASDELEADTSGRYRQAFTAGRIVALRNAQLAYDAGGHSGRAEAVRERLATVTE